jgi:hypothetical protein
MYTKSEFQEIHDLISGRRRLSSEEIGIMKAKTGGNYPRHLGRVGALIVTNPELYAKVMVDENPRRCSIFGFFPETIPLFYSAQDTAPQLTMEEGTRGGVVIVKHPKKSLVIKPFQTTYEQKIAAKAAELGVGPKQYDSLDHYITEQFIEGTLFSRLSGEQKQYDRMYNLGIRVAEILKKLHANNIYYNDVILSDDFGRSHLLVPERAPAILIDYGVALSLDNHPHYSDEEALNYARTKIGVNLLLESLSPEKLEKIGRKIIEDTKRELSKLSKEEIFKRDAEFIGEGLGLVGCRIGTNSVIAFNNGFEQEYYT